MRKARFAQRVSMIPLVKLYLDPYFSCDRVNVDSSVNEMYILFVTLHSLWSRNEVLCSLSLENLSLFIMWMLSCVMMAAVSSICLISSNMCWCTFDELMTWFCFSGRISRVNFVVYFLSLRWLHARYGGYRWCFCHRLLFLHDCSCC